jgi:hypothetical protein
MIRRDHSELAANRCWFSGTTGGVRAWIRPLSFADPADKRASGGHSHVSNGPGGPVPGPYAPSAPRLADGKGPFKTHRLNYCGAVQSNPSCAMHTLQATGDIRKVSLWLGHATLQSTEVYLRADPTEKLEAMASLVPPTLRRGRGHFRPPDKLLAMLRPK